MATRRKFLGFLGLAAAAPVVPHVPVQEVAAELVPAHRLLESTLLALKAEADSRHARRLQGIATINIRHDKLINDLIAIGPESKREFIKREWDEFMRNSFYREAV